ncbi:MAG: hypothetical protein ACKVRO_18835 [Micropepsaceae bacterium]
MDILNQIVGFFQTGSYGVNVAQGLIIAAVAAYIMNDWRRVLVVALACVFAHLAVDVMLPVFRGGAFRLPPLVETGFWVNFLRLYAGYLIVVNVFYAVKRLLGGGH